MPIEYVNRRGERYYLLQGKTKTGKPKYYVSRKPDGVPVEQVPEGYELYENPERGLVSVRKVRPTRVLPAEREQLARWTRELAGIEYCIVDIQDDSLVVYTADTDPGAAVQVLRQLFGAFADGLAEKEDIARRTHYTAMLRFTLIDEQRRLYEAARWCFRGAIDGWFHLAGGKPLETLARKYLPHLKRDSFYELM